MSAVAWIVVGGALWLAAGVPLALLIGRVVRERDVQVPTVAVSPRPESVSGCQSLGCAAAVPDPGTPESEGPCHPAIEGVRTCGAPVPPGQIRTVSPTRWNSLRSE